MDTASSSQINVTPQTEERVLQEHEREEFKELRNLKYFYCPGFPLDGHIRDNLFIDMATDRRYNSCNHSALAQKIADFIVFIDDEVCRMIIDEAMLYLDREESGLGQYPTSHIVKKIQREIDFLRNEKTASEKEV